MCGGSAIFQSAEKTENMLMNLFMPLCLRVGSGRKGNFIFGFILMYEIKVSISIECFSTVHWSVETMHDVREGK